MDTAKLLEKTGLKSASDYQIAIFQHVSEQVAALRARKAPVNLIVDATAGSGKTTTTVAAAKLIPLGLRAGFFAFNKSIATELSTRLPKHVEARTLNSLGFRIYGDYYRGVYNGRFPKVEPNKVNTIMRNLLTPMEREVYGADVKFLVGMMKSLGVVPSAMFNEGWVNANGLDDSPKSLLAILDHYNRPVKVEERAKVFALARDVLAANNRDEHNIDFDDQKYFPVVKRMKDGSPIPVRSTLDVVMVDEAQDMSPIDLGLVRMVLKPTSLAVFIGDRNQSIYGFRGADADSMDKIKAQFSATSLPLSITYRCGRQIVEQARSIYSVIEAAPNAIEGEVVTHDKFNHTLFVPGDMVVCRNNAPTVKMAFKLIRNRVPVVVKGRDIGKDLIGLINKLVGKKRRGSPEVSFEGVSVADLTKALTEWLARQTEAVLAADPDDQAGVDRLRDRHDTIRVFIEDNTDGRVETVLTDIEQMFSDNFDPKTYVVLSSMHKSKGLEADRVFILDQHLMFPRWIVPGTWQEVQEKNLQFVAYTRAKTYLGFIQSDNMN